MTNHLTVLIPCKNECENIGPCVASLRSIADEILVADSGSSDGTIQIAKRLGCRVVEREYVDAGDFKNWAIPQARHGWVLIVDADERIPGELAEEIRHLLKRSLDKPAYSIRRRNMFLGHPIRHGDWSFDRVTRLVRRDRCRYACFTDHAEIDLPRNQVGRLHNPMIHYTAWDLHEYLNKMSRYAAHTADAWHAQGRQPSWLHLLLNPPLRFLRGYLVRGGFLDGRLGFQIASLTAYYSFLKQFHLWQRVRGRSWRDVERTHAAARVGDREAADADSSRDGGKAAASSAAA